MNPLHAERNPRCSQVHALLCLLQTPFSPFSEICPCHLCEHEGHLVESCLLPAECTLLASAPRLLILAPENQHMPLYSEASREEQNSTDFSLAVGSRDVQFLSGPLHSLCSAQPFVSLLTCVTSSPLTLPAPRSLEQSIPQPAQDS